MTSWAGGASCLAPKLKASVPDHPPRVPATGRLYSLPICLYSWAAGSCTGFSPVAGMVWWASGLEGAEGPIVRTAGPGGPGGRGVCTLPLWTRLPAVHYYREACKAVTN